MAVLKNLDLVCFGCVVVVVSFVGCVCGLMLFFVVVFLYWFVVSALFVFVVVLAFVLVVWFRCSCVVVCLLSNKRGLLFGLFVFFCLL